MIYIIRSILAAPLLLLALLASSLIAVASDAVCYDTHRSLVFDDACDLTIAANDVAVSRFTCDECHRVTRAETLVGETMFDVAWRREDMGWDEGGGDD